MSASGARRPEELLVAPAASVVIPTYNRPDVLARTLEALSAVRAPTGGFDAIVVDDGSDEQHAESVRAHVAVRPWVRLIGQENAGPAAARNAGLAASSAPLVVFLDDDCRPAPDWLIELIRPFEAADEGLGAVGGAVLPAEPESWAQRFCAAVEYATGTQPVFENASTQNACYRRDVLELVGGFDEGYRHPGGDDPDLSWRTKAAGYELRYAPEAVVYHTELATYADFLRHMYHRGLGEARIAAKFGRRRRVLTRLIAFPAYLGRSGLACWRRTKDKGGRSTRIVWTALDAVGRTAFLVGTAVGLAVRR